MQTKETQKSREEFTAELRTQVLELLGGEYRTELSQVRKNNGVRKEVLFIQKENSDCIPCFYTEELYRSYCFGETVPGLAEHLVNVVLGECDAVRRQINGISERDWLWERLFFRLVNYEKNEESLGDAVYLKYMDLAVVVYVLTEDSEEGVKSFCLPKHLWNAMEFGSVEACFKEIMKNTERLFPVKLICIEQGLTECKDEEGDFYETSVVSPGQSLVSEKLYVLTNHRKINGAGVLFYPELLQELAMRFNGSFYVIPSSVHETLLLKETGTESIELLNRMICEVNKTKVAAEEVLSNHAYYYSAGEGILSAR